MRKFLIGLLSFICASGLILGAANSVTVNAATEESPAGELVTLDKDELSLLLPGRYEQYLSLSTVSSVAVNEGYVTVADEKTVFLYNGREYLSYTHDSAVVQLEMNDEQILYFLDENGFLYTMDCKEDTLSAEKDGLSCSSFTLANGTMYYAMSVTGKTNIYDRNHPTQYIKELTSPVTTVPSMTYANGTLYYTDGQYFNSLNGGLVELSSGIYDIAVLGETLYYTDKSNLYSYDLTRREINAVYSTEGVSYTALCLDGTSLYVAGAVGTKTKICKFDTANEQFTDYEIATSSSSKNRLISARQSIVSGDYLITADENRLSLYNFKTNTYSAFRCAFTPEYLASDDKSILIANGSTVYVYDFAGNPLINAPIADFDGNVMGVACAKNGDYLLITRNAFCYRIDATDFHIADRFTKDMITTARSMCGDIYGNVYVEYSDNTVYKYTEKQFLSVGNGELYYTFPTTVENISVDFDGNIYGLSGTTLYCSDGNRYVINGSSCLFNATAALRDFAFGYEHGTIYFVYEDYILSTQAIDLPNLNALEAGNSHKTIYEGNGNADGIVPVVSLNEDAVLLHFSLEKLTDDAEVFPYLTYTRANKDVNALVLSETEIHGKEYYIVTVFNATTRQYTAGLVLKSDCALLDENGYASNPDNFQNNLGYITNEVLLYKYPYMTETMTLAKLNKNAVVSVLKELSLGDKLIDYDYYYVSYTNGIETLYGYVPKNFVRDFEGKINQTSLIYFNTLCSETDITATSADNRVITLRAGVEYSVITYFSEETESDTDTVTVAYEKDGVEYFATVSKSDLAHSSPDTLRYFLIVLLLALDLIIVINYCVLRRKN